MIEHGNVQRLGLEVQVRSLLAGVECGHQVDKLALNISNDLFQVPQRLRFQSHHGPDVGASTLIWSPRLILCSAPYFSMA